MNVARALLALLLGLVLMAVTAEVAFRVWNPPPRAQVIRASEPHMVIETVKGEPVFWFDQDGWREVRDRDCRAQVGPDGKVVGIVGDSILWLVGGDLQPKDNVQAHLQAMLDAAEPGRWCVLNGAFSGSGSQQKSAMSRFYLEDRDADYIVWEVWGEGPNYAHVGDDLFALANFLVDSEGIPVLWEGWPVPPALNAFLFRYSAAWQYTLLALAPAGGYGDALVQHGKTLEALEAADARGLYAFFPDLKGPFGQPPRTGHAVHEPLRALLAEHDAVTSTMQMTHELADYDYRELRLDPCCHYNPKGHVAIAKIFARWLLAQDPLPEPDAP